MADASLSSAEAIMADAKAMFPDTTTASEALVGYEASKPTQMVSFQQQQLYKSKASEALALAKEALVSFRRANDKKKVAALKVVVEANMAMDRSFDAMMAASDELAMIKRTGDKQAEVDVAEMLADAPLLRVEGEMEMKETHQNLVLERLAGFAGPLAATETRCAAQALGVQLALRSERGDFTWEVFQALSAAQMSPMLQLSFPVAQTGLAQWRHFVVTSGGAQGVLGNKNPSKVLQWITETFADQELYKKYYSAMEHAEKVLTGADQEDWVLEKARHIRLESERRATVLRCGAGSWALVALRLEGASWARGGAALSAFRGFSSVFATKPHSMEPPFVKPTPPELTLYAADFLHVMLHLTEAEESESAQPQSPFRLVDDAAQRIHQVKPQGVARLPEGLRLSKEEEEQLISDFIGAMLQLNLSLPPDPKAKFAPASLEESAKDVFLGWDPAFDQGAAASSTSRGRNSEVPRVMSQSSECLRWNAALALYVLGMDLSQLFQDAFETCMARWKKRKEQAKVLLAQDVLHRSGRAK